MDQNRFDALTRSVSGFPSRRHLLRGLAGAALGWGVAQRPDFAAAKNQRKRKQQSRKGLCQQNGAPCTKPGKQCKQEYCLRAPFTIEASGTQTVDAYTVLFVPQENATTGPAPYIDYCGSMCTGSVYPFACVDETESGDETTTIHRLLPGKYEYWSEVGRETPAGAVTVVLKDGAGRVVRQWASPANATGVDGVGWHVFDIDGRHGRVTAIDDLLRVGAEEVKLPYGAHDPFTYVCPD